MLLLDLHLSRQALCELLEKVSCCIISVQFQFVFCYQMIGFMYTTGKRRFRNGNGQYIVIGMLDEIRHSIAFIF